LKHRLTAFRVGILLTILLTGMIEAAFLAAVTDASDIDIMTRIERGTNWILAQVVEYKESGHGFMREAAETDEEKLYCEDNSRVAWTLCNYHLGFTSPKHDRWLKAAVEFVLEGQAGTGDFHRYYDVKRKEWVLSGSFYYWNAHIMAMLAQTAFLMRKLPQRTIEHEFWDRVVEKITLCINSWIGASMRPDGGWSFAYPEPRQTRTEDVGMMLNALSCISGYEQMWGDRNRAEILSRAAQRTCDWILLQQEMDRSSWGYGGFYDDNSKALQTTLSNGRAMFGVLAYWTFIGLTVPKPDYEGLRKRMIAWTEDFALRLMDSHGGPGEGRTQVLVKIYPKRTLAAAELIRDLALIWVDLGGSYYWSLAERSYCWLVGKNEMTLDMQQVNNTGATRGGFYTGIENSTEVNKKSTINVTAQCVEAMLLAMSIDIPEFSPMRYSAIFAISVIAISILEAGKRRRRRSPEFVRNELQIHRFDRDLRTQRNLAGRLKRVRGKGAKIGSMY